MKKPLRALGVLCLLVLLVSMPLPSEAAEQANLIAAGDRSVSSDKGSSSAAMSLEEAIVIAKEKVPMPEGLEQFSSGYQENNGKGSWNLTWRSTNGDISFSISVDVVTGDVANIDFYKNYNQNARYQGLPAYSKDKCLEIAKAESLRLVPDKFPRTAYNDLQEEFQVQVLRDRSYPIVYNFNFRKMLNGIPVVDQGINIGINAETGEMISFNCIWDDSRVLPQSKGMISAEEAVNVFKEKSGYELTYYVTPSNNPDIPGDIKPVYRFKNPRNFVINALNGKPLEQDWYFGGYDGMLGGGGSDEMRSNAQKQTLTPAEIKAIEESQSFISAEKAQELAAQYVKIPEGFKVTNISLERHYGVPGNRLWNIQLTNNSAKPEAYQYIWVSLDAGSGELISFNISEQAAYREKEAVLSEDDAEKIAFKYINSLQPSKSQQVVLRQVEPVMIPLAKTTGYQSGYYNFNYIRLINGVAYPENGFRVGVSAFDGEVLSYQYTWWNAKFPSVDSVIEKNTINDKYLAEYPLKLEYSKGYSRYGQGEQADYYLIYRSASSSLMYDALTGQQIDYQGKPIIKKELPFNDIAGHPAEDVIKLLAQEGIVSGEGGKFRPDDLATIAETLAMLDKAFGDRYYYPMPMENEPWYHQVVENCKAKGILEEGFEINPEDYLNRLQLARLSVNAEGWGRLARVSEIFKLEIPDASLIPADSRGYVAAVVGLKLFPLDNGKFNPGEKVTRAQVATYLVKLMEQ